MEKYLNGISFIVGIAGGCIASVFGGWDILLKTILFMTVLDYITGVIKGIYAKQLSSELGFRGILKKVMVFIIIAAANILQKLVGEAMPIREIVIMFFVANEGLSLLENAAVLVPVPDKLKKVLLQIREKGASEE